MRTKQGAIGNDFGKDMNQADIRTARFRIADYKDLLLQAYNRMIILLDGELESKCYRDKGGEIATEIMTLQNQINNMVVKIGNALTDQIFFVQTEEAKENE